jgi:hypothetical protein
MKASRGREKLKGIYIYIYIYLFIYLFNFIHLLKLNRIHFMYLPENAPMCCVIPPNSVLTTDVFRKESKRVVFP